MESILYNRCGLAFELPTSLRYTRTHFWVASWDGETSWRVGFTGFAARVLGELVEFGFEAKPAQQVRVGQKIGWYEGFKGVTDIYCVVAGEFVRHNAELELNGDWIKTDSYGRGWLYEVSGTMPTDHLSAQQYVAVLDAAIESLQGTGS